MDIVHVCACPPLGSGTDPSREAQKLHPVRNAWMAVVHSFIPSGLFAQVRTKFVELHEQGCAPIDGRWVVGLQTIELERG